MSTELADLQKSLTGISSRLDGMESTWRTMQGKGAFSEGDTELAKIKAELAQYQKSTQAPYEEFSLRSVMPSQADFPMIAAGLGSASAGAVGGYLMRFIPADGFLGLSAATLAQLAGGWLIYKFGSRWSQYISAFGGGVVIRAIGELFEGFGFSLGRIIPGLGEPATRLSPSELSAARQRVADVQGAQSIVQP